MAMSTDMVEFTLKATSLAGVVNKHSLVRTTLGLTSEEYARVLHSPDGVVIRCRPSQFARFLIRRNEQGGQNMFKELASKLISPPEDTQPINVVMRERRTYEPE